MTRTTNAIRFVYKRSKRRHIDLETCICKILEHHCHLSLPFFIRSLFLRWSIIPPTITFPLILNASQYEATWNVGKDLVKCTKIPRNPGKIYGPDVYQHGILSGTPGQYGIIQNRLLSPSLLRGWLLVVITEAISLCLILLSSSLSSLLLEALFSAFVAFPKYELSLFISAETSPYPHLELFDVKCE